MGANPKQIRVGSWNAKVGRHPVQVSGDIGQILTDHPNLHALALQEFSGYVKVLDSLPDGWVPMMVSQRGPDQQPWIVREDVTAGNLQWRQHGDGWVTVEGEKHVGEGMVGITLGRWLRLWNLHLPPSIDWHHGRPCGPPERVDDYVAFMRALRDLGRRSQHCTCTVRDVTVHERYDSDHRLVTMTFVRRGDQRGFGYLGDWNCRLGVDVGEYTTTWLAKETGMKVVGPDPMPKDGIWGIDYPLVKVQNIR